MVLVLACLTGGWILFGEAIIRDTLEEAGTKALGAQLDIDDVEIHPMAGSVELRGVALADPFDRNRNLFEIARLRIELEGEPLLQKKVVVRRLAVDSVRVGTTRAEPASPVSEGGFAPRALAEVQRFTQQFRVPLLSLVPIDSLKAVVLDPTKLKAVQTAVALGQSADSTRQAIEGAYAGLHLQETYDSSAALVQRLQSVNIRSAGLEGVRRSVADARQAVARIDSARGRVERLASEARRGVDSLQNGFRAIDEARREDYDFARGLLQLPTFDAPDIGAALFGKVTIDRFQQAMYWTTVAREHAPPGLMRKEAAGPERLRLAGTTVSFATPSSYPRFLLRRADVSVTMAAPAAGAEPAATYSLALGDVTTEPAIIGRPTLFVLRRREGNGDSLRATGSLDHARSRPRDVVNVVASGLRLPALPVPQLPYTMDPGRGDSELRFALDGDQISGRWIVKSVNLAWRADSNARRLNTIESLVARVLTGIRELQMTAEISGTVAAPRLAVRSNLDRQVADRLRSVAGEEVAAAQARVRAQVDRLVDEKTAPVRARVDSLRADTEQRVAQARIRLDEEKRKLEERIRTLGGGAIGLPRLPGR